MPAASPETTHVPMDRKRKKPVMEKRRRARINHCLNDLKQLLLRSLKRDAAHASKLEKADILEMTVHLLRGMQRRQLAMAAGVDESVLDRFQSGWTDCQAQVKHYANSVDGFDSQLRQRLLRHLDGCYGNMQATRLALAMKSASRGIMGMLPIVTDVETVGNQKYPRIPVPQLNFPGATLPAFTPTDPTMPILASTLTRTNNSSPIPEKVNPPLKVQISVKRGQKPRPSTSSFKQGLGSSDSGSEFLVEEPCEDNVFSSPESQEPKLVENSLSTASSVWRPW